MKQLLWFLLLFPTTLSAQVAAGLNGWYDMNDWCSGKFTGTYVTFQPDRLLRGLQRAKQCGISLVVAYPRYMYTTNGENKGPYSAAKHRALSDAYAKALKPDTIKKYVASKTMLGLVPGDDYGCASCWGGKVIPLNEARDAANYAKDRMPDMPVGPRLDALVASTVSGWRVDYFYAQWWGSPSFVRRWSTPGNWFKLNAAAAQKMGAKMFYGINTEDCTGPGTDPCSPAKVLDWGSVAATWAGNCGSFSWYYYSPRYAGSYRSAWQTVFAKAKARPFTRCM